MRGFLPHLFGRFRDQQPAWIETTELQRRLPPAIRCCWSTFGNRANPPRRRAISRARSTCRSRTWRPARRSLPHTGSQLSLVCKTDRRSARAAADLVAAGLQDVAVLRGGTDGWHQRGFALE